VADNRYPHDQDPGDRGRLELAPRVVTRIAELSALQVDHVVRQSSGLDRLVGRRLPRATVSIDRDRVRLRLEVAVPWPCPVETVAADVRRHVSDEVARLTGLLVRSTDVTLHTLTPDHDDAAGSAAGTTSRRVQ
jgi:uncharacterized alkaline shock family protein YloU